MNKQERWVDVQGGRLRVCVQGPEGAPALVFSNSLGTTLEMWDAQAAALRSEFRVLRYDTRGHGASVCSSGPYSFDQLGRDVLAILDALQVQQAHFCGISMGGLTGLWLGVNAGQRLRSLTVANSAAKIGVESAWLERAALVREQGLAPIASTAASRWFTDPFIQSNAATVAELSNDLGAGSPEGYASCCEALAKADLREQIKTISVPVLIVAGQQDPVTTVADGQAMQAEIAQSQLFEINASHISNIEQPEAFNQAVKEFISV